MLTGTFAFSGLTTYQNRRALQCTLPRSLESDEKRSATRISALPSPASITFSTPDLQLYTGQPTDLSLRGVGLVLHERLEEPLTHLAPGSRVQADMQVGDQLALSFQAEIRYIHEAGKDRPEQHHLGLQMMDLSRQAAETLHQWLFKAETRAKIKLPAPSSQASSGQVLILPKEKQKDTVLVISPRDQDLTLWQQSLRRKFQVLTSDFNIANIRQALSTGPLLCLVFLDAKNLDRASFTRKLCASLGTHQALMFFGEEPAPEHQKTLTGALPHLGFLDITKPKILSCFRQVDRVMNKLGQDVVGEK